MQPLRGMPIFHVKPLQIAELEEDLIMWFCGGPVAPGAFSFLTAHSEKIWLRWARRAFHVQDLLHIL